MRSQSIKISTRPFQRPHRKRATSRGLGSVYARPNVKTPLLSVLLILSVLAGCDDRAKRTVEHVNRAVRELNQGNGLQAKGHLKHALKIDPKNHDANFYLGFLKLKGDEAREALSHLKIATQTDPEHAEAWLHLARAHFELGSYRDALNALNELFKRDAGHPNGHYLEARIALKRKEKDGADRALRAAIAGDPGFAPAYLLLSRMYTDVGAYELAMKVLNEGLRFTPEDVGLMEALGLAWLDMGEPSVARGVFKIAVQSPRADYTVHLNYAAALLQTGARAEATQEIRKYLLLGQNRANKGDLRMAARMLIRLKRL